MAVSPMDRPICKVQIQDVRMKQVHKFKYLGEYDTKIGCIRITKYVFLKLKFLTNNNQL